MAKLCHLNPDGWLAVAGELNFNATRLARRLHISRRQLERYTRAHFDCSPQHWLTARRMELAARMLIQYRRAKEAANQLGFKQMSHFSREFKLSYGMSPREYLASCDQNASAPTADRPPRIASRLP